MFYQQENDLLYKWKFYDSWKLNFNDLTAQ